MTSPHQKLLLLWTVICTLLWFFPALGVMCRQSLFPFASTFRRSIRARVSMHILNLFVVDMAILREMNRGVEYVVETRLSSVLVRIAFPERGPMRMTLRCSFHVAGKQELEQEIQCMLE